ncbi:hypothetical protein MRX96_015680 [Rhipicephalus microplus]
MGRALVSAGKRDMVVSTAKAAARPWPRRVRERNLRARTWASHLRAARTIDLRRRSGQVLTLRARGMRGPSLRTRGAEERAASRTEENHRPPDEE